LGDPSNPTRYVADAGWEYYYQSNDSVYFLDGASFVFIYDFSPQVGDQWLTGSSRVSCPVLSYPGKDAITVTAISPQVFGTRIYDLISNDGASRYYTMGPVIRNIGSMEAPYPYVNRMKCQNSSRLFMGLICYSDGIRGYVPMPNSTAAWCHTIITSLDPPLHQEKGLLLFPNPVGHFLYVQLEGNGPVHYTLHNVQGQPVASGYLVKGIDPSSRSNEMYYLTLRRGAREWRRAFIKQ
jgi:hypothetical protein